MGTAVFTIIGTDTVWMRVPKCTVEDVSAFNARFATFVVTFEPAA